LRVSKAKKGFVDVLMAEAVDMEVEREKVARREAYTRTRPLKVFTGRRLVLWDVKGAWNARRVQVRVKRPGEFSVQRTTKFFGVHWSESEDDDHGDDPQGLEDEGEGESDEDEGIVEMSRELKGEEGNGDGYDPDMAHVRVAGGHGRDDGDDDSELDFWDREQGGGGGAGAPATLVPVSSSALHEEKGLADEIAGDLDIIDRMIGQGEAARSRLERNEDGTLKARVDLKVERRRREVYRVVGRFDSEEARAKKDERRGTREDGWPLLPSGSDTDDELFRDFGVRRKPAPGDKGGDGTDGDVGKDKGRLKKWRKGKGKKAKGKRAGGDSTGKGAAVSHSLPSEDPEREATEKQGEADGLYGKGEWKAAADLYTKAVKLAGQMCGAGGQGKGGEDARLAGLKGRGLCYLKLGKPVKAAKDLAEVVQARPSDVEARVRRAEARRGMGEVRAALSDAKAARRLVQEASAVHNLPVKEGEVWAKWGAEVDRLEAELKGLVKGKAPAAPMLKGERGDGGGVSGSEEGDEDFLSDETSSDGDDYDDEDDFDDEVEKRWKSDQKRESLEDQEDAVPVKMGVDSKYNPHGNSVPKAFSGSLAKAAEWSYGGGSKMSYHMKVNWIQHLEQTGQEYGKSSGFRLGDYVKLEKADLEANPFFARLEARAEEKKPTIISPAARATLEGLPLSAPVPVKDLVQPDFKPGAAAFGGSGSSHTAVVSKKVLTAPGTQPQGADAKAGHKSKTAKSRTGDGDSGKSPSSKKRKKQGGDASRGASAAAQSLSVDAGASFFGFGAGDDDAAMAAAWKQQSAALNTANKDKRKRTRREGQ